MLSNNKTSTAIACHAIARLPLALGLLGFASQSCPSLLNLSKLAGLWFQVKIRHDFSENAHSSIFVLNRPWLSQLPNHPFGSWLLDLVGHYSKHLSILNPTLRGVASMTCVLSDSPKCLLFSQATWNYLSQTFKFLIEKSSAGFNLFCLSLSVLLA